MSNLAWKISVFRSLSKLPFWAILEPSTLSHKWTVQFGELKFGETSHISLYLSKLLLEMGVKKKLVPYCTSIQTRLTIEVHLSNKYIYWLLMYFNCYLLSIVYCLWFPVLVDLLTSLLKDISWKHYWRRRLWKPAPSPWQGPHSRER